MIPNELGGAGLLNNEQALRTDFFNKNCSYINENVIATSLIEPIILGLNVQSLLAKEVALASFIDNLKLKPHIICLQEIHQVGKDPPLFAGYHELVFNMRIQSKGGVSVF